MTQVQEQGLSTTDENHLRESCFSDPDLVKIVKAWPDLPEHIKAAIKALIQTYKGGA